MTDRYLSFRGVRELTSLSESTIRRLVAEGKLPQPETLTAGRRVFVESAVREAVQKLIAERRSASQATTA